MEATVDIDKVNNFASAIEMGYRRCLRDRGELPRCLSNSQAERKYTGALLKFWWQRGLVEPIKTGDSRNNKVLWDAERLEVLYASTIVPYKPKILKTRQS